MQQKGKHLPANVKPTFSPVKFWRSFKSALNDLPCESIFWKMHILSVNSLEQAGTIMSSVDAIHA